MNKIIENSWLRNGLLYGTILVVIGLTNLEPIVRGEVTRIFLAKFLLVYTLTYVVAWLHNHYLVRKLLLQKKYSRYIAFTALLVVLLTALFHSGNAGATHLSNDLLAVLLTLLFGLGLYLVYHTLILGHFKLRDELYRSRLEVAHLKSQMNPHFLFNALNNLYGVSVSDAEQVPDTILVLSDMLRYQIESSKQEKIPLNDEIHFLNQYLAFERLRFGHRAAITFQVQGESNGTYLAPLLLFPFVENAFKYGSRLAHVRISMQLGITPTELTFSCENEFNPQERSRQHSTQTGLDNTRKRLTLLYPQQHHLAITEKDRLYRVHLRITL